MARRPRRPRTKKVGPQQQGGHKPKPKLSKKRQRKRKPHRNARRPRSVLSGYVAKALRRVPVWKAIVGLLGAGIFLYYLVKSGSIFVAGSLTLGLMLCLGPIIFAVCSLAKAAPGRVGTSSEPEFSPQKRWRGEDPDKTDDLAQASPARSVELMDPRGDSTNPMQF